MSAQLAFKVRRLLMVGVDPVVPQLPGALQQA